MASARRFLFSPFTQREVTAWTEMLCSPILTAFQVSLRRSWTALRPQLTLYVAVFSGGTTNEAIKFWDIRNKQCVYELSTGSNAVSALAWNPKNSTLYAATNCSYVDMGQYDVVGYRRARVDASP